MTVFRNGKEIDFDEYDDGDRDPVWQIASPVHRSPQGSVGTRRGTPRGHGKTAFFDGATQRVRIR